MFEYIYVLDYSYGGILEIKLKPEDVKYLEENNYNTINNILKEYDIRGKDCNYMLSEHKLEIEPMNT